MYEAVARFSAPIPIRSGLMLIVAIAGLLVNALVLRVIGHQPLVDRAFGWYLRVADPAFGEAANAERPVREPDVAVAA